MTIPQLVERVEAGEIVVLDGMNDCLKAIEWAAHTNKDLRGWTMKMGTDRNPPTVTFSFDSEKRRAMCS